jgi:hypothetical protein
MKLEGTSAEAVPARQLARQQARQFVRESAAAAANPLAAETLAEAGPQQREIVDDILLTVAASTSARSAMRAQATAILEAAWQAGPERRLSLVAASVRTGSHALANRLLAAAEQQDDTALRAAAAEGLAKLGIDAERFRD